MEFIADEEFQHMSLTSILKHSIATPRSSPKTFFLMTLILIFPLSVAILLHSYIIHSLMDNFDVHLFSSSTSNYRYFTLILFCQFFYYLLVLIISLLSTSASVFTIASLYTSNTTTFSSTIFSVPRIFPRLSVTFFWISLLMLIHNAVFYVFGPMVLFILSATLGFAICIAVFIAFLPFFLLVHVYMISLWQLASVVTVLEPVYGLGAMRKSQALLKGKMMLYASVLVLGFMFMFGVISSVFDTVVTHGWEHGIGLWLRILVGVVMVGLLVGLNLVGLMVQSLFYFVCKSFHQENIDKKGLHDLLSLFIIKREDISIRF